MILTTQALNEVLDQARKGDQRCWDQLFEWIEDRLRAIVRSKMRSRFSDLNRWIEESDAMSESRKRLYKFLSDPEVEPASVKSLYAMLGTIIERVLLDFVRDLKRGNGYAVGYRSYTDGAGRDAQPRFDQVADTFSPEVYFEVIEAISKLDHETRQAVQFRFLMGMTVQQVAEATGSSVGTAHSRIRAGQARLQELYQP